MEASSYFTVRKKKPEDAACSHELKISSKRAIDDFFRYRNAPRGANSHVDQRTQKPAECTDIRDHRNMKHRKTAHPRKED